MQERRLPLIGDPAPQLRAQTTHGPINFPNDYGGKWVVLFSHPADYTPVCTTEFVAFQKRYDEFKKLGCELIGLSIDQVFSHIKWDRIIVPPPASEEGAKGRLKEAKAGAIDCYDWWFCHKKLSS